MIECVQTGADTDLNDKQRGAFMRVSQESFRQIAPLRYCFYVQKILSPFEFLSTKL